MKLTITCKTQPCVQLNASFVHHSQQHDDSVESIKHRHLAATFSKSEQALIRHYWKGFCKQGYAMLANTSESFTTMYCKSFLPCTPHRQVSNVLFQYLRSRLWDFHLEGGETKGEAWQHCLSGAFPPKEKCHPVLTAVTSFPFLIQERKRCLNCEAHQHKFFDFFSRHELTASQEKRFVFGRYRVIQRIWSQTLQ